MKRSLPLLFVLLAACVTTTDSDLDDVEDTDAEKADGVARPAGVFSRREATGDELMELMLFPDKTYLRFAAFGDWRERGTYTFSKSTNSSKRYIRFLDDEGTLVDRYSYTMSGSVVRLDPDGATKSYPMFSVATGEAAWVEAIKADWFDEAFQDWGATAFPRTGIRRGDLPVAARAVFDQVADSMGPNQFPLIYTFDLHGRVGFEIAGGEPNVRLFDAAGTQVASGNGDDLFNFEWN
jgi:hypothetical protein